MLHPGYRDMHSANTQHEPTLCLALNIQRRTQQRLPCWGFGVQLEETVKRGTQTNHWAGQKVPWGFCTVVWANPAFPGALAVGNLPASAGDTGSVPDPGRVHVPQGDQVHELRWLSPCSATKEQCGGERPRLPHPDRGHTHQQGASMAQVK